MHGQHCKVDGILSEGPAKSLAWRHTPETSRQTAVAVTLLVGLQTPTTGLDKSVTPKHWSLPAQHWLIWLDPITVGHTAQVWRAQGSITQQGMASNLPEDNSCGTSASIYPGQVTFHHTAVHATHILLQQW